MQHGLINDLEVVSITNQDFIPVQSTPDGDSIDLPTPQLVKPNEVGQTCQGNFKRMTHLKV